MTLTVTDLFAGAGGSSTGMVAVPGVEIRYAANHWKLAIAVHNQNHPETDHAAVDLHQEDPRYFATTDVLWASPECTKWSQANGSKPLPAIEEGLFEDPLSDEASTRSRLLMFDVLRFAEHHRYRVMIVENVVDVATQAKYRLAWHVWRQELVKLGYRFRVISLNSMHAQAFGAPAPQSRDRLYVACWLDGHPAPDFERILRPRAYCGRCDEVVESRQAWKPGKTVGRYRQSYVYVHAACGTVVEPGWRPAADAIDWSIPGELIGDRLMPKTRARIAAGIARYWGPFHLEAAGNQYDAADPNHPRHGDPDAYYRAWSVGDVLRTLHTGESKALAVPVEGRDGKQALTLGEPLRTQTTRLETAIVTPFIAELRGGGSDARIVTDPAATFCASGNHHGLVTPSGGTWNDDARPTGEALRTLQTRDAYALVTPYYGSAEYAKPTGEPIGTLTTVDRYALVHRNNSGGAEMTTPAAEYLRTLTTAGHQSLIQAEPRGGRPKVSPADLKAAEAMVSDCLFRMFRPLECAAGQAFPRTYEWNVRDEKGRAPSNRDLVKMIGNAVTPPSSRDLMVPVAESFGLDVGDPAGWAA
jgi:DNA (cytosine-5)-methyltransferase 1